MATSDTLTINPYEELQCHHHELILNEDYHAHEGKLCFGCGLILHSSCAVYRCIDFSSPGRYVDCAHFFIHKSCAHLPSRIKHPSHKHIMSRVTSRYQRDNCHICGIQMEGLRYICDDCNEIYNICLLCVVPLKKINIYPAYHSHKLTLSTRFATFQCDACHEVDTDFSYMCYTCPFYIHLSCSNLPNLLECQSYHKHPLSLAYSLPEIYRKFPKFCRICTRRVYHSHWLYYCPNCRFFAHIKCATSPPISSKSEKDEDEADFDKSKLVYLPAPDHGSLLQQCIKKKIFYWLEDAPATPPVLINHWSHQQHQMVLKHRSCLSITEADGILICNGCTKSISTGDDSDGVFYECSECEYILHRFCALIPKEVRRPLKGKLVGIQPSVHDIWSCTRCNGFRNGIQMQTTYVPARSRSEIEIAVKLDIECALLPKLIKHDVHPHLLTQGYDYSYRKCIACQQTRSTDDALFKCVKEYGDIEHGPCKFQIHIKCALKPLRVTHQWDRHPLHLIFSPEEVIDHPHEFNCEFCSEEIDTNCWFYHCSICDLSFHLEECIDLFPYSRVKFGATNIQIQGHQHSLTFVLNKKRQPCQKCHKDTYGKPVLECASCKFIQHAQLDLCS